MEEAVTVSEPCSAVDIVPTLSNLFGLEYDSRLLSGRDVLDQDYDPADAYGSIPLVILPTAAGNSWATAAGVYESSTRTLHRQPRRHGAGGLCQRHQRPCIPAILLRGTAGDL